MAGDFITINRSLLTWEWYDDINTCRLFVHLLLSVNWKPGNWKGKRIERGQTITSREKLSDETGLSIQQVRTSLSKLKSTGEITIKTTSRYTVVTVNNYNKYQDVNQQNNQPITSNQPANNQQITTIEQEEQVNNKTPTATTARESQLKRLSRFYEGNNFGMMPRYVFEEMNTLLDEGLSDDLIEHCMKEAVASGKPNWKYAAKIIQRCQAQKIETVDQFEAERKKTEDEKASRMQPFKAATGGAIRVLRDDI